MSFWHGYRAGSGMTFSLFPGARFMIASVAADGKVGGVMCKLERRWLHAQQAELLPL